MRAWTPSSFGTIGVKFRSNSGTTMMIGGKRDVIQHVEGPFKGGAALYVLEKMHVEITNKYIVMRTIRFNEVGSISNMESAELDHRRRSIGLVK
jgi:hypothetical protein